MWVFSSSRHGIIYFHNSPHLAQLGQEVCKGACKHHNDPTLLSCIPSLWGVLLWPCLMSVANRGLGYMSKSDFKNTCTLKVKTALESAKLAVLAGSAGCMHAQIHMYIHAVALSYLPRRVSNMIHTYTCAQRLTYMHLWKAEVPVLAGSARYIHTCIPSPWYFFFQNQP